MKRTMRTITIEDNGSDRSEIVVNIPHGVFTTDQFRQEAIATIDMAIAALNTTPSVFLDPEELDKSLPSRDVVEVLLDSRHIHYRMSGHRSLKIRNTRLLAQQADTLRITYKPLRDVGYVFIANIPTTELCWQDSITVLLDDSCHPQLDSKWGKWFKREDV